MRYNRNTRGGKFDIVNSLNSLSGIVGELHTIDQGDDGVIRKSSFTGPNTDLNKRLDGYIHKTGEYTSVNTPPINKLDQGALEHDLAYSKYKDLNHRHEADKQLIKVANEVLKDPNSTKVQKYNSLLVKLILNGKVKLGVGLGGNIGYGHDQFNELIKQLKSINTGDYVDGGKYGDQFVSGYPQTYQSVNTSYQPLEFQSRGNNVATALGIITPLLALAGAVGIPKIIKLLGKKEKKK